ncbi:transcription activator protein [Coccinia mosaic Tamil Nadu virus]|uniref:Transcriptional activator protein n=1 Tax=Coccinia mosaic Tamil Nadu virus TaxID=1532882 RepID=A0A076LA84_9GEMI|nr:transcription activator protein [Coccinia mosaic Tamil Nadu virus]AIJ03557.1 transcription activator protein [Coccinia mosaic Tamil Nadu virus]WLV76665.1 transcription activator protein [Coccinia mosaic Tamil Nadu virus]
MPSSTPSKDLSTPAGNKTLNKRTKRSIRRRRIDLKCGCTYYYTIACHDHGFTHRGVHYCGSSREWRVYLDGAKSPLFQNNRPRSPALSDAPRRHQTGDTIQPQHQEGTSDSQVFSNLPDLDGFTTADWAFLESL